jgi:transmembrane 9 superfamily protein 2/4
MGRNETCKVLCRRQITPESAQMALNFIRDQYVVEWFLDGLPISQPWVNIYDRNKQHNDGFPLGYYDPLVSMTEF